MKKTLFILLLVLLRQIIFSQKKDSCYAGVYLTKADLIHNHVTYKINKDAKGFKFGFPSPADLKLEIRIESPDTVIRFKEGSVYGYCECGNAFRYSEGGELYAPADFYKIVEIKGLVIYTSVFTGGDEYFYSLDLSGHIHRLKVKNIERDFKEEPEFVEAVKCLSKQGERGNIEKKDTEGHFIINKIYADKIKNPTVNAGLDED